MSCQGRQLRYKGKAFVFLPFLQRETTFMTFCLLPWTTQLFKTGVYSDWNELLSRSKFFLLRVEPIFLKKGDKNDNSSVASPESIPLKLKLLSN